MILRRFMQHIKEQNWFAVGLDVIVVIVGIFLGLQVQDWETERQNRIKEDVYLNRLHSEVLQGLNLEQSNFDVIILKEEFKAIENHLINVAEVFDGTDTNTVLDHNHCGAVVLSHIYNGLTGPLPTITELQGSGQMSLIQNEGIKDAISNHSMAYDSLKNLELLLNLQIVALTDKYPNLMTLDFKLRNVRRVEDYKHQCDFDAMKLDVAFTNDLMNNISKLTGFNRTYAGQQEMLHRLHVLLDRELGIVH